MNCFSVSRYSLRDFFDTLRVVKGRSSCLFEHSTEIRLVWYVLHMFVVSPLLTRNIEWVRKILVQFLLFWRRLVTGILTLVEHQIACVLSFDWNFDSSLDFVGRWNGIPRMFLLLYKHFVVANREKINAYETSFKMK